MAGNSDETFSVEIGRKGRMLVSADRERFVEIDSAKVSLGSFFTTDAAWLNKPVREFLSIAFLSQGTPSVLDPFAGDGHLLELVNEEFGVATFGLDIAGEKWARNDSLVSIPNPSGSVIVTNPPYLANHSAKRKGVDDLVASYFDGSDYDNLYKIALERCLEVADYVVAVIPETFLLSSFPKQRLQLVSVIESEIFSDTEAPTVVACFGPSDSNAGGASSETASVFINQEKIGTLAEIMSLRNGRSRAGIICRFNVADGRIGLRAVDSHDGVTRIGFELAENFGYRRERIKVSSRLLTYIEVPHLADSELPAFIERANDILNQLREQSSDLILAPFKGNDKLGKRRRRLDYALARQVLNAAAN